MDEHHVKSFFTYLQSQQTAQQFLKNCYKKNKVDNAESKSYENCNAFMYYLNHGLDFYETGKKLNTILQPILLFYGMIHMLKATLLTKRPNYPETTKLLAHGVSSRKRKKKHYSFMNDEVKIQHNGLFPYFSRHLFSIEKIPFEKIKMQDLFAIIPEMNILFGFDRNSKLISVGNINGKSLSFPIQILDDYFLTERAFIKRILPFTPDIKKVSSNNSNILIQLQSSFHEPSGPFFFNSENQEIYFPMTKENFVTISEVMAHYLLLYNLSMISRYETEWWGDLISIKPEKDYPFIIYFLQLTSKKIPMLLGKRLYQLHTRS